ncbi:MAG: TonB-dependent receptor, partial [Gammaproteobacteria bacterium]
GIQYDTPEKDWGQLSFRVDASYQDDILFSATDTTVGQEARTLLNGRITLSQIPVGEGDLKAAVWGRNLTDEEYRVHGTNFGFYTSYLWGEPRTFGVDVTYEF